MNKINAFLIIVWILIVPVSFIESYLIPGGIIFASYFEKYLVTNIVEWGMFSIGVLVGRYYGKKK